MEILSHDAQKFSALKRTLHHLETTLRLCSAKDIPSQEEIELIKSSINTIKDQCKYLNLKGSLKIIDYIAIDYKNYNCGQLSQSLSTLQYMINRELGEQVFLYIPQERIIWFNKVDLFGAEVSEKFKLAQEDIKESGNCYAVGLYTACVFHVMRVLEHGLRALVKNVGLKFYRQSWGTIIKKIKDKIDLEIISLSGQPKDIARTERLQFLSQIAQEFTYFKDGWRNYVMHGEDKYDGPKALSILNHVKTFMAHLATRLSE